MIDAHLHLQDLRFPEDLSGLMEILREAGISRIVVNGTCPDDWNRVAELADTFPEIIPSFGLHPWKVNGVPREWKDELEGLLLRYPGAGVGEIGLDRWIKGHDLESQSRCFQTQLDMAGRLDRPLSIHCLQAWGHLRECLEHAGSIPPFLLHSFGGPAEMIDDFVERGAFFSVSGYFFRADKAEKLRVFEKIPEDRILLETDAPDMMPPPELVLRAMSDQEENGPLNHPVNLASIYQAFADWRGLEIETVIRLMRANFDSWFRTGNRSEGRADSA